MFKLSGIHFEYDYLSRIINPREKNQFSIHFYNSLIINIVKLIKKTSLKLNICKYLQISTLLYNQLIDMEMIIF